MCSVKAGTLFISVNNRPDSLKAISLKHAYRSVAIKPRHLTGCEGMIVD
jgi:hypothetical protein